MGSAPAGGYFICLDVLDGCARQVVRRCREAGLALTPAGSTHPYGDDPRDRTIRIAPTHPALGEVEAAAQGLAASVRLVGYQKLLSA